MQAIRFPVRLNEMFVHIRWVNEWQRPEDFDMNRIILPYHIFWLFLSGAKTVIVGEQEFKVGQGDLLIVPPHVPFAVVAQPSDKVLHHISLVGDVKIGISDMANLFGFPRIARFSPAMYSDLLEIWHRIIEKVRYIADPGRNENTPTWSSASEARPSTPSDLSAIARSQFLLNVDLNLWLEEILRLFQPLLPPEIPMMDERVLKVCYFIKRNLRRELNLHKLATHAHMSVSHLRLLFQRSLGQPPMDYVRMLRVARARELLLTTSEPMAEVSEMCGFTDPGRFSKVFRAAEGISPQSYRRQAKQLT